MFDFLYENKVSISILLFVILLIIIAGIIYYYYGFTKEEQKKEEEQKEQNEEEQKEQREEEQEEQKEEIKSSIEMIYEYKVFFVLIVLLLLTTIDGIYYYNYENKIALYILIFLIVLIILISIISILYYYYYYDNIDKNKTAEENEAEIIKSLEEGPIEERKKVLLSYLDKNLDYQNVSKIIYYLKKIGESKRIELYKNMELNYIEKISIVFNSDRKIYINEILDTLKPEDEKLLYTKLRKKNIFLDTERDIIGSKLKNIINLLDKDKDEKIKEAASKICFEKFDSNRKILIEELKKRNIYHKIVTYVSKKINDKNYGNASCKRELLK